MNNRATYDPQEYMNLISLLEQALKFYANDENYVQKVAVNNELCSYIELDNGQQAKYALDQIKNFDVRYDVDDELFDEFKKNVDTLGEMDTKKIIETIKKLKNDAKNTD